MHQPIIVGCDLHDRSMLLKTAAGMNKPKQKSFRNDQEGRRAMMGYLRKCAGEEKTDRIVFVYEASGQGFGLYDLLVENRIECYVLSPTHLPRTQKRSRNKTDAKDAQMLLEQARAFVLAGNSLPTVWVPPQRTRDDRELLRARLEAAEARTRVKAQIFSLLKRYQRALPDGFQKSRHWTRAFLGWLYETANDMDAMVRPALLVLVDRCETIHRQVIDLERHIRHLAQTDRYRSACQSLRNLPGVGLITAMTFLTEMGDLTRFSNRRQVASYLGLCPSSSESGESDDRKGHITHQGPSRIRKVLCQAAWVAVGKDAAVHARWERIRRGSPSRGKKAIVAIMRQLGIQLWHLGCAAGVPPELTQRAVATHMLPPDRSLSTVT